MPKLEVTEADKANAFASIENLLQDPFLAHDPDVKKALPEMQTLKCVSYLSNLEAQERDDRKRYLTPAERTRKRVQP